MTIHDRIAKIISDHPVVLFMKGTADEPQCGFSAQVVNVLNSHGTNFQHVNVLAEDELREGIKAYTNWPTIPQLYVNGEFIGGCDIVMQLERSGELKVVLEQS
ncbi:MAG: Grx4 family monothiol glutaredoxin [Pseudomonadota bacterium]|nr:Grx4 family monothiol glutaredoxin [Pseudomonadota bacterium]